jgi:cold shock CspA family protein
MQGTVKEFSEETRSGSVILDDGTEIPLPPEAFSRSGLLKLQYGQRVRFEVEGEGDARRVRTINITTLY